jgi:hypothetical protein
MQWFYNLPEKMQKILKGALIAILGLLATFLEEQIPGLDFGKYAVYAVALNSIIVNALKQYIIYCSIK